MPTRPGSDWRDIPNVDVVLPSGATAKALEYTYSKKIYNRAEKRNEEVGGQRGQIHRQ